MVASDTDKFPVVINMLKALSDRNRLRTFMVLLEGELCVCQIVELLQLAPSTVSKHLSVLNQSGLLGSYKKGRWVYYHISKYALENQNELVDSLATMLKDDPQVISDLKNLQEILKTDPEQLCKMQSGR